MKKVILDNLQIDKQDKKKLSNARMKFKMLLGLDISWIFLTLKDSKLNLNV